MVVHKISELPLQSYSFFPLVKTYKVNLAMVEEHHTCERMLNRMLSNLNQFKPRVLQTEAGTDTPFSVYVKCLLIIYVLLLRQIPSE